MRTGTLMAALLLAAAVLPCAAQEDWLSGVGRGATVEEADREALRDLGSRVCIVVSSLCRVEEDQTDTPSGTEYRSSVQSRVSLSSSVILTDAERTVSKADKGYTVIRRIPRSRVERVFSDRRDRVLDFEECALRAEGEGRLGDALRFHCWAYMLLSALDRPGDLRAGDGTLLVNAIPRRMNGLFDSVSVTAAGHGGSLTLSFTAGGRRVESVDFTYFDGARWSDVRTAYGGAARIEMAPGALAETIQVRLEYVHPGEAMADPELAGILLGTGAPRMRRSVKIFRRI